MGYKIGAALLVLGLAVFSIARAQNNSGGNNGTFTSPVTERTPQVPSSNLLPTDCGQIPMAFSNRSFGDSVTKLNVFPWMALLVYRRAFDKPLVIGGGTLISKRYVLTAAHSLKGGHATQNSWTLHSVRLGEYTLNNNTCIQGRYGFDCADGTISVGVEDQIVHKNFNPFSKDQRYDIALLRLSRDVAFTDFIKPICLPRTSDIGQTLVVAGWGTAQSGFQSEVKLKMNVSLVDKEDCRSRFNTPMDEGQICAGGVENRDMCRGDSGNPLMQEDRLPDGTVRWSQAGIVSFETVSCDLELGTAGVYTNVSHYKSWIISKLRP